MIEHTLDGPACVGTPSNPSAILAPYGFKGRFAFGYPRERIKKELRADPLNTSYSSRDGEHELTQIPLSLARYAYWSIGGEWSRLPGFREIVGGPMGSEYAVKIFLVFTARRYRLDITARP